MALRARLVAPQPEPREVWPWHQVSRCIIGVDQLTQGDRRMEAETYLSSGRSVRSAIEAHGSGWTTLGNLALVTQPARLKGILVPAEHGTPFLAATQVFDVPPVPRKWLAIERMARAQDCFVEDGTILVTRSGLVGRTTLAYAPHRGVVISDDLLRVKAKSKRDHGWLYAFLRAPQSRSMATSAQYGHIIKHLETSHLEALPVPKVDEATADDFSLRVARILEARNECYRLNVEAESKFEAALGGPLKVEDWGEGGFVISSSALVGERRRFDASVHNPGVATIRKKLAKHGATHISIAEAGYNVWLPTRFRRIPASDGVLLLDSADLTEVSPELTKKIADGDFGDPHRGRVKASWVLMARSGQTYGIIGTTVLAGAGLEEYIVSDHVMRIAPGSDVKMRAGYLVMAMSHPTLGRPIIKSLCYGSSIPELDVADIAALKIVRLKRADEDAIADLVEASASARRSADTLEAEIAKDAARIVEQFMAQRGLRLVR